MSDMRLRAGDSATHRGCSEETKTPTHTPGPWGQSHRQTGEESWNTEVYDAKGETIATLAWYPVKTAEGVSTSREANAHLIAAAPDLLAALQAIFDAEEAVADVDEYDLEPTIAKSLKAHKKRAAAWKKARRAVVRAEGA